MIPGYAGKIGWVDLTKKTTRIQDLEETVARKYIGGKGLGAYLLYKHLKPNTHPYDPDNMIIFVTGPLTGTNFPAVSRSGLITKSPLTGTFLDSYSGGFFGTQLKWAGFDALVIVGKADKPVYIIAEEGDIQIHDAGHLWGLSTSATEERLRGELTSTKGKRMSITAIGQAGENLVRFSNVINEKRAHGRGGSGAVMGSKNLKAVVVRGNRKPRLADEKGFKEIIRRCRQKVKENPMTKKGGFFPTYGTMATIDVTQQTGTLPTRNWQENSFDGADKINGEIFVKYQVRQKACFGCPIGCSRDLKTTRGKREYVAEGPEYETMYAMGAGCGIYDPEVIIAADTLCDEYGLDTISCGVTIGFAMECFEKGLITVEKAGGIELRFGDGNMLLEAIHNIARKEGIGELLSEGVKRISEKVKGSHGFAMHVKGLELPGYDPRGMKGQGLTYAVADRGGCHLRANMFRPELLGLPGKEVDRYAYGGKAEIVRDFQIDFAASDCVILCLFAISAIGPQDCAEAISKATGWPMTYEELRVVAERAWNLTRLFNVREGFTRKDDTLPERLFNQSSTIGPTKGEVMDRASFEKLLDEYYESVGWDKNTGIPTENKIKDLGIHPEEIG